MFEIDCYNEAIDLRNDCWKSNPNIPNWVNIENVGLDQFFTHPDIAILYYNQLLEFLSKEGIEIDNCIFIEPSAGAGSFFDLLPKSRSIGLDIYPIKNSIDQQDFLSWELPEKYEKKIKIFIGNPPFGYRGWLALSFMNHVAKYADYVGFILPMSFQSDGKGSPKNRVRGLRLKHSEIVPKNCFVSPLGKVEKVNALWQIWKKGENLKKSRLTCKQWI
ncbi:MAG: type II restriction endonuclease [Ekhidna sp.]|nr:type II restriction endonuclease [Ekhidna sp.]MBC6426321.1 type II restriction endonuclease [Ekhidna sp.]